jgi:hypothetical protein
LFASTGGAGAITVQEGNGCGWKASTNSTWLNLISGGSAKGNGTIRYAVTANTTGVPRDGIFIIGDQVFRISQAAQGGPGPL